MLDITVTDPEMHSGSKVALSFVDFKVTTTTDDIRYAARNFFVRRRYRDFVWLRSRLTIEFPGTIVPPLPPPDKPYKGELKSFSNEFVARRQAGLELFLRRVAAHRILSTSGDLLTFLEAKVWELQTAKNASAPTWMSSVVDATDASVKRATSVLRSKAQDDDEVERLRSFASEYHAVVTAAETAHLAAISTIADAAADLSHLGPAFDLLSQSERELSLPFSSVATTLDALRELFLKQVQMEHVSGLTALLAFNSGMAASLKDVLKNRDAALVQYTQASAVLDARTKECQRWQSSQSAAGGAGDSGDAAGQASSSRASGYMSGLLGSMEKMIYDPDKGSKLKLRVQEAERAHEECSQKWSEINHTISTEAASFHMMTNADFARGESFLPKFYAPMSATRPPHMSPWRRTCAFRDEPVT